MSNGSNGDASGFVLGSFISVHNSRTGFVKTQTDADHHAHDTAGIVFTQYPCTND